MPVNKALTKRLISLYSKTAKTKSTLFGTEDLIRKLKLDTKAASNLVYSLHREGTICRHKEKGKNGKYQYALEIATEHNDPYAPLREKRPPQPGGNVAPGLTAIQKMFANIQNMNARLEDMIMAELAEADKVKKQKSKVASLMRSMEKLNQEY